MHSFNYVFFANLSIFEDTVIVFGQAGLVAEKIC